MGTMVDASMSDLSSFFEEGVTVKKQSQGDDANHHMKTTAALECPVKGIPRRFAQELKPSESGRSPANRVHALQKNLPCWSYLPGSFCRPAGF